MRLPYRTLLATLVAAGLLTSHHALGAAPVANTKPSIKCWTNKEGLRECGNAIPPEYSQQESRTVNSHGVTVETQKRAKTAQELAREAKNRSATENQAAEQERIKAEKKRQAEERMKADQLLLAMFASESDIVNARDRKVSALQGNIDLTNVAIEKHQQKVDNFRKRIEQAEKTGKPAREDDKADMAAEIAKIENKKAYIATKNGEIEAVKAEYDGYLTRFRDLKTAP